jgi:WD40 repeat protein
VVVGLQSVGMVFRERTAGDKDDLQTSYTLVKVWKLTTGPELTDIQYDTVCVTSLAFSPDSSTLISGGISGSISCWNVASGKKTGLLLENCGSASTVAFSPNEKQFVSGHVDGNVNIWDTLTGKVVQTAKRHAGRIHNIVFSPDGGQIASSGFDEQVRVWEWESKKECCSFRLNTPKPYSESCTNIVYLNDGKHIVYGTGYRTVMIRDVTSGTDLQTFVFSEQGPPINCIAVSHSAQYLAAGSAEEVKLWNLATSEELRTLTLTGSTVCSLSFNTDGSRIAAACMGGEIGVWDTSVGDQLISVRFPAKSGRNPYRCVAFSPDGTMLAASTGESFVRLLDGSPLGEKRNAEELPSDTRSLTLKNQDSKVEVEAPTEPALTSAFKSTGWSGAISPKGESLLVNRVSSRHQPEGTLVRVDLKSNQIKSNQMTRLLAGGKDCAWAPDGSRLVCCVGKDYATELIVLLYDGTYLMNAGPGYSPSWSQDNRTIYFIDMQSWKVMALDTESRDARPTPIYSGIRDQFAQVSPNGDLIAAFDAKTSSLVVSSIATGKTESSFTVEATGMTMKCWNSSSTHVAFADFASHGVWILNAATGKCRKLVAGSFVNPKWSSSGSFISADMRARNTVEVFEISNLALP